MNIDQRGDLPADHLLRLGNLLRSGRFPSREVREECIALNEHALGEALDQVREAVEQAIPAIGRANRQGLSDALTERDRAESVVTAVAWLGFARGTANPPSAAPPCAAILRRFDAALSSLSVGGAAEFATNDEHFDPSRVPSDASVQRYVTEGVSHDAIERFARVDGAFSEELASVIDALGEMGEERSLAARIWRAQRGDGAPRAHQYCVDATLFALAAASEADDAPQSIQLGPLPGVPAEASLEVSRAGMTLQVFAAAPLVSVTLDEHVATASEDREQWACRAPLGSNPITLVVLAEGGARFDTQIQLVPR